ncbi:MAG: hypothetical protein WA966_05845 [Ornithinimicrobium sp.]
MTTTDSPATSNLYDLVTLPETTFTVEPVEPVEPTELRINVQHGAGSTTGLTLTRDGDLATTGGEAEAIFRSARGALVLGFDLDGEGEDRVLFAPAEGTDAREVLRQGIETLTIALEAVDRMNKGNSVTEATQ